MKTVIGIVGSYRKEGVVDSVVDEVLAGANEAGASTEKVYLLDFDIEFCRNCRSCMQMPGPRRGECIIEDDIHFVLDEIERADCLVLGAPVNVGDLNALTRRFIERCVCYGYWPWNSAAPKERVKEKTKKSVLVSSSAAPAWMARIFSGAPGTLKKLSGLLGARPVGMVWVGMVNKKEVRISEKTMKRARRMGKKLVS